MANKKEKDFVRIDPFMVTRLRQNEKAVAEYEATLDPRQFQGDDHEPDLQPERRDDRR